MLQIIDPASEASEGQRSIFRLVRFIHKRMLLSASFAVVIIFLVPVIAFAQEDPERQAITAGFIETLRAQVQVQIDAGHPELALELVAAHESSGSGDPDYDYLLGTTALAAGQNTLALQALERVVLVQPSYVGAWLDLAIAHFRVGEIAIADGLLKHVEEQFDPPATVRAEIAEVRRGIARAKLTSGWQAEVGVFAGRTSNANLGLSVSSLEMNLGGTNVSLLLDRSYAPRADGFKEIRTSATGRFNLADGAHTEVYTGLRYRALDVESNQSQVDATVAGTWRKPTTWTGIQGASLLAAATARNLAYPGRSVAIGQLSLGLSVPTGRCQLTSKLDYEQRQFSSDSSFNASIPWAGVGLECSHNEFQFGGQQRLGFDKAENDRLGGDTLRAETVAFGRWQLRPNLQLGAIVFYAYSKDSAPYSPILAEGHRRWINRFGQKIEAIWVPGANPRSPWAVVMEIENIRDSSNIGLSTLDIRQFQVGLVYRYF
jgi:hypothetical protein